MQNLIAINTRETDSVKQHEYGFRHEDEYGRVYRYVGAGGTALGHGKLTVASTGNSNVVNVTAARTYAVGATAIVIDAGGTIVADVYEDGTLTVSDATGEGYAYRVSGNTGVTGAGEITVYLKEPLVEALTIDVSEVTLLASPWQDIVISATDQADQPVGVPNVDIAANEFGWVQTRGVCAVWADEAFAAGDALVTGGGTAGQVEAQDTDDTKAVIGTAMYAPNAAGEYPPVYLKID